MFTKQKIKAAPLSAGKLHIAVVAARYNMSLVDALLGYTLEALSKNGIRRVRIVRVPGSYEVPVVAMRLAKSRKYHAIIALGVVLQGKTLHAEHIVEACSINLQRIAVETGVPVIHQILTPRNKRDALARLHLRGMEAVKTAIEMGKIMKNLR